MTRRRLLAELDSRELSEWAAFWQIEHLGGVEDRSDLRMGILAATIANSHRDGQMQPTPFTAMDFLPRFDDAWADDGSASTMSPEDFSAMLHTRFPMAG